MPSMFAIEKLCTGWGGIVRIEASHGTKRAWTYLQSL